MTADELRTELKALGWRVAPDQSRGGWYAWKSLDGAIDCTTNRKPPGLTLIPWEHLHPNVTLRQVEFEVRGEVGGDEWLSFKVYSVPMDQALDAIPRATEILLAAWNAAAATKTATS